jgi:hypothetical protein
MPVIIFVNKKQFPYNLFILIVITAYFAWNLLQIQAEGNVFNGFNYIYYIFYSFLLVITLYRTILQGYNYLYAVFSEHSRLVIDDKGIDDRLTIYSLGQIDWTDVESIEKKNISFYNVLLIRLKNPEAFIEQQSGWKRRDLKRLKRKWGTPMIISQRIINYNLDELELEMKDRFDKVLHIS